MKKIFPLFICLLLAAGPCLAQNPAITAWLRNTTGLTGYNSLPANVQSVYFSSTYSYVSSSDIPAYSIGPWTGNPNVAAQKTFITKFTLTPAQNTGTKTNTGLGAIGMWSNGVAIYNAKDGNYWNGSSMTNGITYTGWNRNAYYWEGGSFDACKGHPSPDFTASPSTNGIYHLHVSPKCLYDQTASAAHSPIIGFAFDGFPIYGAYGFTNTNGTGGIKRMVSGYSLSAIATRSSGTNGTSMAGPPVNATYPLGSMCEDYVWAAGTGDLDAYNGRFCVTPDYPGGIYAYFATIDASGLPAYPFVLAAKYYGIVGSTATNNTIPGGTTQYIGQVLPVDIYGFTVQVENKNDAVVRWFVGMEDNVSNYRIERSSNGTTFKDINITPATNRSYYQCTDLSLVSGKYYYRIKTTDRDGSFKYSNIVSVAVGSGQILIVHNNPAKDMLTVQSNNALVERNVCLYNSTGQLVLRSVLSQGVTMQSFNIQTLYSGMYVLKVSDGTTTQTAKVIIGK